MRNLILLGIILVSPAGNLWAIDWSHIFQEEDFLINREAIEYRDWRLPDGCRRESLSPDDDEVEGEDCERIICGGHFWGESAIDVCCADYEEGTSGQTCHSRQPTFANDSGEWREVHFPRAIEHPIGCGNYLVPLEEYSETTSGLVDFLLPALYAHPAEAAESPVHWSAVETLTVSNTAAVVADIIQVALVNGDPDEVGEEGSRFRSWVEDTWLASRFVAHVMSPIGFPACPPQLTSLCDFIGHRVEGNWADMNGFWGSTHHLDSFVVARELALDANPTLLALVMETSIHEVTHILFHWTRGLFEDFTSPSFDYNLIMSPDPVLNYEDEMSASIIGIIAFHFLSPGVREMLPAEMRGVGDYYENVFANSIVDEGQNLAETHPESYVNTFFWESLTQEQRDEIFECVDWMFGHSNGLSRSDQEVFLQILVFCIGERLGQTEAMALLQQLNNKLLGRGGGNGIGSGREEEGMLEISHHADLHRDYLGSPETETSPGGSSEGEPPSGDFDWHHPGNFTEDPNDPDYEPSSTSNYIPPECVGTFGAPETAEASAPPSCFNWCWSHFPRGRDGGICQQMVDRDVESGCAYSTGDQCEEESQQRLEDCDTDASFRNSEFCLDACGSSGSPAHCDELCTSDRSLPFCDNICGRNHTHGFCGDICHNDNNSHGFCQDRCVDDPGRPYCDNICVTNSSLSFCDDTCSRNRSYSYCDDLCAGNPGLSFCDDFCSENSSLGFCDDVCRRNNSYAFCESFCEANPSLDFCASSGGGETGCSSGWTYPDGWRMLQVIHSSCFPYVGEVQCCGSNCQPREGRRNHACVEDEYCGCPTTEEEGAFVGWCTDPVSGLFCQGEWAWCDGVCVGNVRTLCLGGIYVAPVDNYHCACNWNASAGMWDYYDPERCRTWR